MCEECIYENEIDQHSFCNIYQYKERIFKGSGTREELCKWLFSEEIVTSCIFVIPLEGTTAIPSLAICTNAILPDRRWIFCKDEFRHIFVQMTSRNDGEGIDPFARCITIASACNLVFLKMFLEEKSIGIIPPQRYRPIDKQSVKAMHWIKYHGY